MREGIEPVEQAPARRYDVTSLGEVMLRLSVPAGVRLEEAARFDVFPAGTECNTLSALARLDRRCALCTALPASGLGRLVRNRMRAAGLSTDALVWFDSGRLGAYFVEFAAPPRPIDVIYDRAGSCFTQLSPQQVDWPLLLDTRLLLLTGITPPLAPGCENLARLALENARAAGVPVAFDVNYRSKLWSPDAAAPLVRAFAQGVEVLFCKQADAALLFGVSGEAGDMLPALAAQTSAKYIVMTAGERGVFGYDGQAVRHAAALPVTILDRIGAGDALAAGVLHGWLSGDFARGLRYGVALAALAMSQHGDAVVTTEAELQRLASAAAYSDIVR